MSRVIAVVNHKGGVAKTTTVASVGAYMALKGKRVLLVDLDAQSNLTGSLLAYSPEKTIYEALKEQSTAPTVTIGERLDLVPASLDLAGVELELAASFAREYRLKDALADIESRYDIILLDCPPSLGLLTLNALTAATDVLVPLTAEALPLKGLTKIEGIVAEVQKRLNTGLKLSGVIITRYNGRKLNKLVEEQLQAHYGSILLETKVRENIALAEAPLAVQHIASYSPNSNGAKDYEALTEEIIQKLETK